MHYKTTTTMKKHLAFFALLPLLFAGCKVKYCSGFPDDLTDILPYTSGQTIKFVNGNGFFSSWKISEVYQQHPEEIKWCEKCECAEPTEYIVKIKGSTDSIYSTDTLLNIKILSSIMENQVVVTGTINYANHYETQFSAIQPYNSNNIDTIMLLCSSDSSYYDSLLIVRGIGLASFTSENGHKYVLVE